MNDTDERYTTNYSCIQRRCITKHIPTQKKMDFAKYRPSQQENIKNAFGITVR